MAWRRSTASVYLALADALEPLTDCARMSIRRTVDLLAERELHGVTARVAERIARARAHGERAVVA